MLDERKAGILGAVVEAYIETAQPVGSSSVARSGSVDVSSSTIRNEMALLESEGYLDQPHTSAGRVPTEKAYRFFVDNLLGPVRLDRVENQQIKSFFDRSHIEIEQMLQETSNFLASLNSSNKFLDLTLYFPNICFITKSLSPSTYISLIFLLIASFK